MGSQTNPSLGKRALIRLNHKYTRLALGASAVLVATFAVVAQPPAALLPVPPPPALNQIVTPDINKLGLLDCAGPDANSGVTLATGATMANCGQYLGFPITNAEVGGAKRKELVALGKALFWDMRVGSDGVQACATCHFHAGADSRTVNQLSPGLNRMSGTQAQIAAAINPNQLASDKDQSFTAATGATAAVPASATQPAVPAQTARPADVVNGQLSASNFPLIGNPRNTAAKGFGNNDVVSSQGVHSGTFVGVQSGRTDNGNYHSADADATGFNLGAPVNKTARRVEPRNTPTTIMAGYNLRNFWDGRANQFFNGVNPFGMLDPTAKVLTTGGLTQVMLPFSSLASQAVGPPGSPFEMSLDGRALRDIGKKVLSLNSDIPLDGQHVAGTDSSLGVYANAGTGLSKPYASFIQDVFQSKFWNSTTCFTSAGVASGSAPCAAGTFTMMEYNFGLFFGVAVQAYEQTLVPDQTPLDPILAFMTPLIQAGTLPDAALTAARTAATIPGSSLPIGQRQALVDSLRVFLTPQSNCFVCHVGAEFTGATVSTLTGFGRPVAAPLAPGAVPEAIALVERMIMGDGNTGVYDSGFYNIGVRPTADDLSIFNRTPGNVPFSVGMLSQEILRGNASTAPVAALLATGNLKQPVAATGFPAFTVDLNPSPVTAFVVGCAPPAPNAVANGVVGGAGCKPLAVDERLAIRGAFKSSTLRNTKFMGPYFHNGGRSTVTDVIAGHYNVGGIFNLGFNPQNCAVKPNGTSGTKGCLNGQVDFDAAILNLGLTNAQIGGIVSLIEFGLTDDRVAKESGPFDHPQLCVPAGHDATGATLMADVPAVGIGGNVNDLQTFADALNPADSGHEHKLVPGSCSMPAFPTAPTSVSPHP